MEHWNYALNTRDHETIYVALRPSIDVRNLNFEMLYKKFDSNMFAVLSAKLYAMHRRYKFGHSVRVCNCGILVIPSL